MRFTLEKTHCDLTMSTSHGIIAWHHRMASSHVIIVCEDITRTVTPFSVHTCPYPYIHGWVQR